MDYNELFAAIFMLSVSIVFFVFSFRMIKNSKIKKVIKETEEKNRLIEEESKKINDKYNDYYNRYKDIINIDDSLKVFQSNLNETKLSLEILKKDKDNVESILNMYSTDYSVVESGLYSNKYSFVTSEKYKDKLSEIIFKQKELIKTNVAITIPIGLSSANADKDAKQLIQVIVKLLLHAYNGECDSLISNVKFSNINKYIERLGNLKDKLNKLSEKWYCKVSEEYHSLKIEELMLVYEYQEKVYEEKEEQKRIKEQMREEEKVKREYEKVLKELELEEKRKEESLIQARKEYEQATEEDKLKYEEIIKQLEYQLEEAKIKERNLSQAQLTKKGHVYVISNIGSFGENIFKVGMTRRLEPMDRIDELNNASVPFDFDVHAMMFSDNAPDLEYQLHNELFKYRVNKINNRKEFFKVPIETIKEVAYKNKCEVEFTLLAEAKEYYETLSVLNK